MNFITPKCDWYYEYQNGEYVGDYFTVDDYNRIKNNLIYLKDLACKLYEKFTIRENDDKSYGEYLYANEINIIEINLETINKNTVNKDYGKEKSYVSYGRTIDCNELNRIESAILDLYNNLTNEYEGRRKLTFNFGTGADL